MTEWSFVTDDMPTEEIIEQARVPNTSYPHKSECAYILADRISALSSEVTKWKEREKFWKRRADQRQIDINELKQNPALALEGLTTQEK